MHAAPEPEAQGGLSIFEKSCAYCGARFRVLATEVADPLRASPYEFDCPACGKPFEVYSGTEPEVRLLRGRTDGKDDRYQETMF